MAVRSRWSRNRSLVGAAVAALAFGGSIVATVGVADAAGAAGSTRQVALGGTTQLGGLPNGPEGLAFPEFVGGDSDPGAQPSQARITNRSYSKRGAKGAAASSAATSKSNPDVRLGFDGIDHRDQRLANGGNQFSLEPPDQGLCAGNGRVVEAVNDALRVYDTSGAAVTGVTDLNTFLGYPAAVNRTTGARGPFVTDPSCLYDGATQRWFLTVLTLDVNPASGAFLGTNHIDVAVSAGSDPAGSWRIYRVPVQDNGTQGTPDHHCTGGFCLGDYPHIGADANGFYVTTNEYEFFGDAFIGAQLYAFSKQALASGAASVGVTQVDTSTADNGNPGFTIWPAVSSPNQFSTDAGGTEYLLSSNAAEEANGNGQSSQLLVWALTNTSSLSGTPALGLSHVTLPVNPYAVPPKATQKAGPTPQRECLNIDACATQVLLGAPDPFAPEPISRLDSNDTRMQQVTWANGKLWGALDTALQVDGSNRAGIEYFVVKPTTATGALSAKLSLSGYLGLTGSDLTYPAIGVTPSGRGVMAFTLTGDDRFPSAGYASLDGLTGAGAVHVAAAGLGPQDGFTGYSGQTDEVPPRPRWGDYGATAVDGTTIWVASEYIAQTCTLSQYLTAPIGSCGGTRTALANWGTRITALGLK
ncbi:hypothetical protein [Intrasporangium flavum]|uniref:hypothetical protein n=1 Tax=Intrasporangium flavum TaxID=1428657 RepID=UPI00096BFB97|nr:hypothetical protein [Intrasporangium flavum]